MNIGILSETHGNVSRTCTAIDLLINKEVEAVIHCGDIGSEEILLEICGRFGNSGFPVFGVLGNVDQYNQAIEQFPEDAGIKLMGIVGELILDGKSIAVVHGHHPHDLYRAIHSGKYDYILTGHTHVMEDRREGNTRIINPGAVCRAAVNTVAVLDTRDDNLVFYNFFGEAQ